MSRMTKDELERISLTLFEKAYKEALYLLGNKKNAEDIAADAYTNFLEEIKAGVNIEYPIAFIARTARNLAKNFLKERQIGFRKLSEFRIEQELIQPPEFEKEGDLFKNCFEAFKAPLFIEVQSYLNLNLTPREEEAFKIYLLNIQRFHTPYFRQIGNEINISNKRAHYLVQKAKNKLFLNLFISDILQGKINHEIVEALTKDWRENPFRALMNKIANFNPADKILTSVQANADEFFHRGVTALESMIEKGNKINPRKFFKGYTYLFTASSPCWRVNQKTIIDFGEEYILKNPKIPWIIKQVAFRANNLAGSLEFQTLYKEHLLRMIENPSSKEAIQTTLYISHYFDEFDFKDKVYFIENALIDIPYIPKILPQRTIAATRTNIQEDWYRSKVILMEINFLRCYLVFLVTESFSKLKEISKSHYSIYQITTNILRYSLDKRVMKLAEDLSRILEPLPRSDNL